MTKAWKPVSSEARRELVYGGRCRSLFSEPKFCDGVVAQAINRVAVQGVAVFSEVREDADVGQYQARLRTVPDRAKSIVEKAAAKGHIALLQQSNNVSDTL